MAGIKNQAKPSRQPTKLEYLITGVVLVAVLIGGFKLGETIIFALDHRDAAPALPAGGQASGAAIVNPPFAVHDFTLINQFGAPMSLRDLRGRAVLLFFGYTNCPDVCPATMADFTLVKKALGAAASRVAFVFVSVDGERDTPAVVREFVNHFDPDFIGLTADDTTLKKMVADYSAMYKIPEHAHHSASAGGKSTTELASDNYFVEHTSPAYLIDAKGLLRMVYFYGSPPESIASGVRQVLSEQG